VSKILILSEDIDDLTLYNHVLEREGYECITITKLQDTLHHLQTPDVDVLFIVGFHNFGSEGLEFYEYLKTDSKLGKIPVIIYTPWWPSKLKPNPTDYGDTLFMMPMDIGAFREKVKELTSVK
jgi:response regulator RpfG family c-di-GMP phosphodiesterase